jgi:hypothetical protein
MGKTADDYARIEWVGWMSASARRIKTDCKKAARKQQGSVMKQKSMVRQKRFHASTTELTLDLAPIFHRWFMALVTWACKFLFSLLR